jgi:hypothetical protein
LIWVIVFIQRALIHFKLIENKIWNGGYPCCRKRAAVSNDRFTQVADREPSPALARFGFGFVVRNDIDRLCDDIKRPVLGLLV